MFYSHKDDSDCAEAPNCQRTATTQLIAQMELLYDKYRPRFENPLFESFNSLMLSVVSQGVKPAAVEPLYRQMAQAPFYNLKNATNNFARQAGELLARSECDEDLTYMQELSQYGLDGVYLSESGPNQSRRKLGDSQMLLDNDTYLEPLEFEYFERVYQPSEKQEFGQNTQKKQLCFHTLAPLTVQSTLYERNYEQWKEDIKQAECLSQIEPADDSLILSVNSHGKRVERTPSILLMERHIAPIIQKEKNAEITISVEYQKLLDEYKQPTINGSRKTRESEGPLHHQFDSQCDQAGDPTSSSTKESMRKLMYKQEYEKKLRNGMIATRANPYQLRRRN